jgi:hypothetical protein
MLGRRHPLLLALGIVVLAGCGSSGSASEEPGQGANQGISRQIAGRWTGKLHQKGLAPFDVAVRIGSNGLARVAYTGIECGGDWNFSHVSASAPPRYRFIERIEEGAGQTCKGVGKVSLAPIQSGVPNEPAYKRLKYRFTGGGVTSSGTLHRTDIEHLGPIFKEAGVTLP